MIGEDRPRVVALASAGDGEDLRLALTRLGVTIDGHPSVRIVDVRQMESEPPAGDAPLIVVAGAEDGDALDRMIAAGANQHLVAPFDDQSLARALRMAGMAIDAIETPPPTIATALAAGHHGYLLRVALTHFDVVNAAFGREAGDDLLSAALQRIVDLAPCDGIVERLPGPEFAVLVGDAPDSCARAIVEALEHPYLKDGRPLRIGCIVGIAATHDDDTALALIRRAGVALSWARSSEEQVRWLPEGDPLALALADGSLEHDLPRAIAANEIEVLFQPQVSVADGSMIGVEALARWQHPRHGEIGASMLFSTAARSGLTAALSHHVQKIALAAAAKWPAGLGHLRVSINVSAREFANPEFVRDFLAMIERAGLDCERVTAELTESELAMDLTVAAKMLGELRAGNCRVAIDDFGTGYSSLAYLKALPVDYLKIDKALAQDIAGSSRDRVVVRGVIELARSLGIAVIAEGVETGEQLALLAAEGCQYYQGFLYAPPLSSDALIALVN
jgi:EAL domain-containing protein (putative c-di-GMP-specific phosphodiesterase class I)/GGDEF domain-containing protein